MITGMPSYEIRVQGHLDPHWSQWLGHVTVAHDADGTSRLTLSTPDQAQLHAVLTGLRDIGATIMSLLGAGRIHAAGDVHDPPSTRSPLAAPLRSERLTLRAGTAHDAKATFEYRRLPSVAEWLTEIPADCDAYRATFTQPGRLAATVIVELDGVIIGDFMLRIQDAWAQAEVAGRARGREAELGWVLDPSHTGHGYATEAVRELLRYCFEELGVRRVVANCFTDNTASWRLMERVGMRREAHTTCDSLHRSGRWLDGYSYALLAEEWQRR